MTQSRCKVCGQELRSDIEKEFGLCPVHLNKLEKTKESILQATITKDKNSKKTTSTGKDTTLYDPRKTQSRKESKLTGTRQSKGITSTIKNTAFEGPSTARVCARIPEGTAARLTSKVLMESTTLSAYLRELILNDLTVG